MAPEPSAFHYCHKTVKQEVERPILTLPHWYLEKWRASSCLSLWYIFDWRNQALCEWDKSKKVLFPIPAILMMNMWGYEDFKRRNDYPRAEPLD